VALRHGSLRGLSISFLAPEKKGNAHGGYDYPKAHVLEISLTPLPANPEALAAALGGKRPADQPVLYVLPSERVEPRYLVDPAMLARAVKQAVASQIRKELCYQMGLLDDDPGPLKAALTKVKQHGSVGTAAALRKVLSPPPSEPTQHHLVESSPLDVFKETHPPVRPLPPLVIPPKFLRAAAE
jgi:hypothetical protein